MTNTQKEILRELVEMSHEHGLGSYYPLHWIAKKLGITEVLYDHNTNTGILWDLGQFGKGYIRVIDDDSAAINRDLLWHIENLIKE